MLSVGDSMMNLVCTEGRHTLKAISPGLPIMCCPIWNPRWLSRIVLYGSIYENIHQVHGLQEVRCEISVYITGVFRIVWQCEWVSALSFEHGRYTKHHVFRVRGSAIV